MKSLLQFVTPLTFIEVLSWQVLDIELRGLARKVLLFGLDFSFVFEAFLKTLTGSSLVMADVLVH